MDRRSAILLAAAGSLLPVPTHAAKKLLTGIPLRWMPTDNLGDLQPINTTGLSGRSIQLQPFADARENRERIGENREDADKGRILPVSTRDDVPAFVTDRFRYVTHFYGLDTVPEPGDMTISGEVRSFFVTESETYVGDVSLKLRVTDRNGALRWEGVTVGSATRWGRSYKADNYYETLSDSLLSALHKLLSNSEFVAALRQ